MGRDKLSVALFPFHEHGEQLPLACILDETAKKEIGHSHAEGDADDSQRSLMALFMPTVTSPTTPCISMKAKRARYISTPGIIGMTLGMVIH